MCTVSWAHQNDGFDLMCNRDELRTRSQASAPAVSELRGVRFIAPSDGDHGGTWIGVNQFGVALCLLNRYGDQPNGLARSYTSRGLLVKSLIDAASRIEAQNRVAGIDLRQFQPFTLAVFEPGENCLLIEWTGREMETRGGERAMPLISSSFDPSGARDARASLFENLVRVWGGRVDARLLMNFHKSHAPARGPYSPCMHRTDARTVSFSYIKVAADSIRFFYLADSPCSASFENADESITIERSKQT